MHDSLSQQILSFIFKYQCFLQTSRTRLKVANITHAANEPLYTIENNAGSSGSSASESFAYKKETLRSLVSHVIKTFSHVIKTLVPENDNDNDI